MVARSGALVGYVGVTNFPTLLEASVTWLVDRKRVMLTLVNSELATWRLVEVEEYGEETMKLNALTHLTARSP